MNKIKTVIILLSLFTLFQCKTTEPELGKIEAEGLTQEDQKAISSVRKFIGYVRYSKKSEKFAGKAIEMIDLDDVCNLLLDNKFNALSVEDKNKFKSLIGEHVQLKAFPQALKYFEKIDLVYGKPTTQADRITIPSTLVYKGSDRIKFSWVVSKKNYKIVDLLNEKNSSSMKESRDTQILPYFNKQGIKGLNEKLEQINSMLKKSS